MCRAVSRYLNGAVRRKAAAAESRILPLGRESRVALTGTSRCSLVLHAPRGAQKEARSPPSLMSLPRARPPGRAAQGFDPEPRALSVPAPPPTPISLASRAAPSRARCTNPSAGVWHLTCLVGMPTKKSNRADKPPRRRADQPVAASDTVKQQALEPFREDGTASSSPPTRASGSTTTRTRSRPASAGPSLLEDFILREKITHFDHERIPERVVHARGAAAHGYFQVYESLAAYTKAAFLQDPAVKTPVFVRFSTVAGSRGSTDLARDVRGFAIKFYTEEGNFDLVGNNIPVFFIQDAIKFPDLIHAVKPEPHNEIPQAASAHDTFWDFISLMPESMHMIMWVMSDRAIPRSFRMMEGFGVHTFRLSTRRGRPRFVKFHWKPLLGVHSVAVGRGAEDLRQGPGLPPPRPVGSHRERRLSRSGSSACRSSRRRTSTSSPSTCSTRPRSSPRSWCRCERVGKLTLDRNPDNFFAETEQVAFHPGHVVPGIDFTNDPLLQGRLFSYIDTQLMRLGGPNFHEIPINRPVAPVHNNQRDGLMRQTINRGRVAYHPNTLGGGCPLQAGRADGGFVSLPRGDRRARRCARAARSSSTTSARRRCSGTASPIPRSSTSCRRCGSSWARWRRPAIRERMVGMLAQVDRDAGRPWSPRDWGSPSPRSERPAEPQRAGRRRSKEVPAASA